tara:strand:- start:5280 stop:5756 length:477 start_codon:yes stop_codon:yes gene_type:complete
LIYFLVKHKIKQKLDYIYCSSKSNKMQDKIDKVRKFHEVFLIGNEDAPVANVKEETYLLRHRLMHEENEEYLQACKDGDLVEIADALGDLLYIWCGSVLKHGLQDVMEDVFNEIQRSNMSKLDKDGKPIFREDGKVMKSNLYFKPDIKAILERHVELT